MTSTKPINSQEGIKLISQALEFKPILNPKQFALFHRYIKQYELKGKLEQKKEELEFLGNKFIDKKLIFSIDGIARRLDGDELILIHKLIDMANEQNKVVLERIKQLSEEIGGIK